MVTTLGIIESQVSDVGFIKIDVEGAEVEVLKGRQNFFRKNRPIILLTTHGKSQVIRCRKILKNYGYAIKMLNQDLYGTDCDE